MKSAAVFLRRSTSQNPKASQLYGTQFIPASMVMELYQQLQAGQYDPKNNDSKTGEPRFAMSVSLWAETDPSKGYILSGSLDTPAEVAARKQQGVTAPQGYGAPAPGYGAPAPAPGYGAPAPGYGAPAPGYGAPAPGYGAPAPAPAPAYPPAPAGYPPAPAPAPAPAAAPAPPAWGAGGGWGG